MNMFLHELKSMRKSAVIWTLSLIVLTAVFFSIYPSMSQNAADYKKLLSSYPAQLREMIGIDVDYVTSILGFYAMVFSFIVLCGAVQAMNIGVSLLSKENRERTADFLLVKPVSRFSIVSSKLLAGLVIIISVNIVFYAASWLIANGVKTTDFDVKRFLMINLTLFFIQLIFLSLGLMVSVFFKKLKSVLPLSLGVVFGLYVIGAFVSTGKNSAASRFISPFRYFDIKYIIKNGSYETSYLAAGAVITVVSILISYIVYIKKDIHAVS